VRSIQFNLKDASNPDLRRRVMTGEIDPQVRTPSASLYMQLHCACHFDDHHLLLLHGAAGRAFPMLAA
jgi:hypothetical protein